MKKISKSLRKYIRRQKALIRKNYSNPQEAEEEIKKFLATLKILDKL